MLFVKNWDNVWQASSPIEQSVTQNHSSENSKRIRVNWTHSISVLEAQINSGRNKITSVFPFQSTPRIWRSVRTVLCIKAWNSVRHSSAPSRRSVQWNHSEITYTCLLKKSLLPLSNLHFFVPMPSKPRIWICFSFLSYSISKHLRSSKLGF